LFSNRSLWLAVTVSASLVAAVVFVPALSAIFRLTVLGAAQWLQVALLTFTPLLIVELFKLFGINTLRRE